MSTVSEKLKGSTAATPHEIMETNHDNLKMSYAQHIAFYRKKKEIKAKVLLEQQRLEELAKKEEEDLIKAGQEDTKQVQAEE